MSDYLRRLRAMAGGDVVLQSPSVSVALRDESGRVLLALHRETGLWVLPGGAVEPGESPAEAAAREMREETGVRVRLVRLVGVFGGSEFVVKYRNGDRTSYVMTVFEAIREQGDVAPDGQELLEVRFASEQEASSLPLAPWLPEVLSAVFAGATGWFRAPGSTPFEGLER